MSTDLTARVDALFTVIEASLAEDEAAAKAFAGDDWVTGFDPARALRRVKVTRALVAAIIAEPHDYVDGDPWFSCSQAAYPGDDDSVPGDACADDERAGKPCDCGRDARVARLLGKIAGEWEEA